MAGTRPKRNGTKRGGGTYAALTIFAVIILAVVGYLLFAPHRGAERRTAPPVAARPAKPGPPRRQPVAPPAKREPSPEHQARPEPPVPAAPKPPLSLPQGKGEYPPPPAEPPGVPAEPPPAAAEKGRLAIIIDDMGASVREARALAGINVPLTFAIIPGLQHYREVAAFAAGSGVETMIHIPMQSKEWPARRLESNGLLVAMDQGEIRERLEGFIRELPRAVGANNHMGSEFTEHEAQMSAVLSALRGRGLFFVDSLTSPKSVGQRLAREMGVRSARRNVFLDNEQNGDYIAGQLNQAVARARKNGSAIAICHPHPVTIQTLQALLPTLKRQGITLVRASQLVR